MTKTRLTGLIILALAFVSWLAENTLYGEITADGVLQESFFLPLTFILGIIGIALLVVSVFLRRRS